jgi:morphogenetic protein associated with SpoVID
MQVYVVQAGDTMSRIANQFGIPLQTLIDANKEAIPDPNSLQIGQEVIIPVTAPTSVPDAGASPSP